MKRYTTWLVFVCFAVLVATESGSLPTLYQYYESTSVKSGLSANSDQFTLNGKPFVLYGGSLHYFRVHPDYWRDTLQRFKAAGLNTVQFYLAWNRHEPRQGQFDFDSSFLNLTRFLEEIRRADLFAVVRVGPYICAEWEFGGFPAWLLRDPQMRLRTDYPIFMAATKRYFSKVFAILNRYQFSSTGGPIIALQFENEYYGALMPHSLDYLSHVRDLVLANHFKELLFTSDPVSMAKTVPVRPLGVLETANLNDNSYQQLMELRKNQPGRPVYVSEFWPGWFDSWGESSHHRYSVAKFENEVSDILFRVNGSINFYMFMGGTNFGFWNGARVVTSYDYDAPLSESGNYTDKYWKTRELYRKLVASGRHPAIQIPDPPSAPVARSLGTVTIKQFLPLERVLSTVNPVVHSDRAVFMEMLPESSGYGFILYRMHSKPFQVLNVTGRVDDRAIIMVNGTVVCRIADGAKNFALHMNASWFPDPDATYHIDVLVENLGRANWGDTDHQRRGLNGTVQLDNRTCTQFDIYPFDMDEAFMSRLDQQNGWLPATLLSNHTQHDDSPRLYRTSVISGAKPSDTYLALPGWTHGNAFVNHFNLGRYDSRGPQHTLYIPGPLLRSGSNTVHIFELDVPGTHLDFVDRPDLG